MPYSVRYLMECAARGKPAPTGSPEQDLAHAVRTLSPMNVDTAFQRGARADATPSGDLNALLDVVLTPTGGWNADPRRALALLQALIRHGSSPDRVDPRTGATALERASAWAATPVGPQAKALLRGRGRWDQPNARTGRTAQQAWAEREAQAPSSEPPSAAPPRRSGPSP